jgi:hypothetical protein
VHVQRPFGGILLRQSPNSRERSPCLRAFMAERALPSGVLGPRFFGAGGAAASVAGVMAAGPDGGWRGSG